MESKTSGAELQKHGGEVFLAPVHDLIPLWISEEHAVNLIINHLQGRRYSFMYRVCTEEPPCSLPHGKSF